MKLYLTAAGIYAGTQVEAKADGKGWRLEEVPTDKYGLIDYLNKLTFDLKGPLYDPTAKPNEFVGLKPVTVITPEALEGPSERLSEARTGPKGHRIAERAALMGTSDEVAILAERIGELDGWPLGQMALAVASRFKELAS
jgi:hypothetical protein